jgi:hypothetical protein
MRSGKCFWREAWSLNYGYRKIAIQQPLRAARRHKSTMTIGRRPYHRHIIIELTIEARREYQ